MSEPRPPARQQKRACPSNDSKNKKTCPQRQQKRHVFLLLLSLLGGGRGSLTHWLPASAQIQQKETAAKQETRVPSERPKSQAASPLKSLCQMQLRRTPPPPPCMLRLQACQGAQAQGPPRGPGLRQLSGHQQLPFRDTA